MDLEFKKIALSKFENIGVITLNRPDILNIFSFDNNLLVFVILNKQLVFINP